MKKAYEVCFGMLAMGLAILGTPRARAQNQMAANGAGGMSEASTTSASLAPAVSSPADLDRRVEELEKELAELRSELAARKRTEEAAATTPAPSPAAATQDKPAEKTTIASLLGPTSLSGFLDTYYNWDSNHPADHNVLACAIDCKSNTIGLKMIELILDKAPDATAGAAGRTGYHVSLGFGETQAAINSAEYSASSTQTGSNGASATSPGFDQYIKEAYFSYLAPIGKGLQIDVGKFVTPMGAEVIESKDNWNYSNGLLYTYAIPIFHFGARAKYTFNSKFNLTGYFVNGFNNVVDNNSGKTYGVSAGWTPTKKNTLTVNYFAGPEEPTGAYGYTTSADTTLVNVNDFWRQTWDLVYTYNLTSKLTFTANYDYAHGDRMIIGSTEGYSPYKLSNPVYWTGEVGYLKYAFNDKNYVAGRYEYFYDRNGFLFTVPHTHVQEFTATYQRTLATHLLTRFEYRRDMSGTPFFELANFSNGVKQQNLLTMGLIFLFDSRDAK
jgi:hypothetical protein